MKFRRENGVISIETTVCLSLFLFAFMSIISLAKIAKVESMTQYAIDQVAKEMSKYYYIASKVGVASSYGTSADNLDQTVSSIFDFADLANSAVQDYGNNTSPDDVQGYVDLMQSAGDDVEQAISIAKTFGESFQSILSDPKGLITTLGKMFLDTGKNIAMSRLIAQPVSRALFPKYISGNNGNPEATADAILKKLGVVDGLDGINFGCSTFLEDGESINVVIVYTVKVEAFGLFEKKLLIQQTASTAAWLCDHGDSSASAGSTIEMAGLNTKTVSYAYEDKKYAWMPALKREPLYVSV
ncbi:MAG: hypothetical protein IK125_07415 [Lachnospiraceae bacterium]|nr:hypothetical protein [Lachnospiraceae bacterium]